MTDTVEKTSLDINELKSGGFIKERQDDLFTLRIRVPAGRITSDKLKKVADVAEKYGTGLLHTTVRQSLEILHVDRAVIDSVRRELGEAGLSIASCGPRVRVPTACGGCDYNPNGITDTVKMSLEVDRLFFGTQCPHKFKISFSGCPIDCARTREMDLGFQGVVEPVWDRELCTQCGACILACEDGAIVKDDDGFPRYIPEKCIYCGDCIKVCPSSAWQDKRKGHLVRVGGKHGKHPLMAYEVAIFVGDDKVPELIRKTTEWYAGNGKKKERIGVTLTRVGLTRYLEEVIKPLGLQAITTDQERIRYWLSGNLYR